jgi:DNA-binding XRE family transcriptional regulator
MAVNVNQKIRKLSPAQRKRIEARAVELIAEEMTLRELRRARKLTQVRMAKALGITQDGVSRLEKPWEAICRLSLSFPTALPSYCPASPRAAAEWKRQGLVKLNRS